MVVVQISKVWHTAVVFGDRATQQMMKFPVQPPQPPQPPPILRGGWFNKCQRLCFAVLSEDWDLAWETADQFYAGPDF